MKKVLGVYALLFLAAYSNAQDTTVQGLKNEASSKTIVKDVNDTVPKVWKTGGLYNLNFNQAALSNWAAGGDNSSLSLSTFLNLYAFYKKRKHSWDNTLNLAYGIVSTTSLGQRKADDRIDLISKYGYDIGKHWYVSTLFNFRSQFAKGYAYPSSGSKVLTSTFMAPAYVLLSEGLDYKPNDNFSVFLSPVTARWIIVRDDSLSSAGAFGVDPGKKSKLQVGAFASVTYKAKVSETATYNTRLDLFSNYLDKPQNLNLYWTNILAVKVTKFVNMSLSVDMMYDDNIKTVKSDGSTGGAKLQLKELLGIGFAYIF
ncbi:DUF3078 domain-containing protein [Segetibacter koreensis]|uniref:DUF3078 domain-containing protein n=1 Tax=Segetibacter koreensis TaxID=398037 RepID=UPI00038007C4|nr:DUF3078 domain-containing protein [Segetibacter koreensis]